MKRKFTRQELYDLVWSQPMTRTAESLGVSNVWLGKVCRQARIPVPERGYWARHAAGKTTIKRPLPPRFPGASNVIGEDTYYFHGGPNWQREMLAQPIPTRPEFDEDIAAVQTRIETMVGKVACPRNFSRAHRLIGTVLEQDSKRTEHAGVSFTSYPPLPATPVSKRWLRIVNAIFVALERVGCRPSMSTSQYGDKTRELSARIGDRSVHFKIDHIKSKPGKSSNTKERLRFSILTAASSNQFRRQWVDTEDVPLERILTTIVIEIILVAEVFYREAVFRRHDWLIELRLRAETEERQRIAAAEKAARELLEKQRQEQIDQLLRQAALFDQAAAIRRFVDRVRANMREIGLSALDIDAWARWAIEQADRIDPVRNGTLADMVAASLGQSEGPSALVIPHT